MFVQASCSRGSDAEEGKAGRKAEETSASVEAQAGTAQVSFLTAALMGVALCFHSILEVRHRVLLQRCSKLSCLEHMTPAGL